MQEHPGTRLESACAALNVRPYPDSVTVGDGLTLLLVRRDSTRYLLLLSASDGRLTGWDGPTPPAPVEATGQWAKLCPLSPHNATLLRKQVPSLAPVVLGPSPSLGTGDRLGLATPGHVAAVRGRGIFPVLAQQSVREMSRTGRAPREVLDDATWGALQAGYRDGYAADADHLRSPEDVAAAEAAGFTMFTVDPAEWVDNDADRADVHALADRYALLPWEALASTPTDCRRAYADQAFTVGDGPDVMKLAISGEALLRAAVKYGRTLAHTATMYQTLLRRRPRAAFTFELSVDETTAPTSAAEHFYVASELKRLDVALDSFAPRFVGEFYKGVEYVGDLARFRSTLAEHVVLARHFGGYRISLHSGSDKFSIYPIVAELARDLVHVKTAGTSYLEALRVVAKVDPALFREILECSRLCFVSDRYSYNVDADVARFAASTAAPDADLPALLDQRDARQVCHVTFGSVLTAQNDDGTPLLRDRLLALLRHNEDEYHRRLREHFDRHIRPFL